MSSTKIGFVLFPQVTQLDFTGPLQLLGRVPDADIHIVAKRTDPIPTDSVLRLLPTGSFATCPDLDVLCVPGGFGVVDAMRDAETLAFVKRQGDCARFITSVCTGAFILGRAGLLAGRRATTHWAYTDLLPLVGAQFEPGRFVQDGSVCTAGGVTAGIDFGLRILAELAGEEWAKSVQLSLEYDPAPPFSCGHPNAAPAVLVDSVRDRYEVSVRTYRKALSDLA